MKNFMKYVVQVSWISPRSGKLAPSDKCLAVEDELCEQTGRKYMGYGRDEAGQELYLFRHRSDAEAFRRTVEDFYLKTPQYFVVDDSKQRVQDEDGYAIVAWQPKIDVRPFEEADKSTIAVFAADLDDLTPEDLVDYPCKSDVIQ